VRHARKIISDWSIVTIHRNLGSLFRESIRCKIQSTNGITAFEMLHVCPSKRKLKQVLGVKQVYISLKFHMNSVFNFTYCITILLRAAVHGDPLNDDY